MSTVKSGGTSKNLRDSKPKFLGVKLYDGQKAKKGSILVRQRGTKIMPGTNVSVGRDHTLYSDTDGTVTFSTKRKKNFDGKTVVKKVVNVK